MWTYLDFDKAVVSLLLLISTSNECMCVYMSRQLNLYKSWHQYNYETDDLFHKQLIKLRRQLLMPINEISLVGNIYLPNMLTNENSNKITNLEQKQKGQAQSHHQQFSVIPPVDKVHCPIEKSLKRYTNIKDALNTYIIARDKRSSYLPVISSSPLMHLGKYFYDLSNNIQFSEQHQWNHNERKLLGNTRVFDTFLPHLAKPNYSELNINNYQPSKKVLWLRSFNPYGLWPHISQFQDPNYMWIGLG